MTSTIEQPSLEFQNKYSMDAIGIERSASEELIGDSPTEEFQNFN